MGDLLVLLALLWTSGVQAEEKHEPEEADYRLVGGASRCSGKLEMRLEEWKPVAGSDLILRDAAVVCERLGCGSALSLEEKLQSLLLPMWMITPKCLQSGKSLKECAYPENFILALELTCSDSIRLLNGTSMCSGRLEVKSSQSDQSNQSWSSVCDADFDHKAAEVVCRELVCGPPVVLQGALYGESEAPTWTEAFQCAGDEFSLLHCRRSGSTRHTCSPGRAVGLTCSEPVRLVGEGASRCAGTLELKHQGEWKPVNFYGISYKRASVICEHIDCGSPLSIIDKGSSYKSVLGIRSDCLPPVHALRGCVSPQDASGISHVVCSDSIRLLNGTSMCSGRLEVKSSQSDQSKRSWSSVCDADFDHKAAEVVCWEHGCGSPVVLQGALYGESEAPTWAEAFQCAGHEFSLLHCRRSGSARHTCPPGRAVGLTCSEPFRLVGEGASRCEGTLELKHQGKWTTLGSYNLTSNEAALICKHLGCGSAGVLQLQRLPSMTMLTLVPECVSSGSALRECVSFLFSFHYVHLTCLGQSFQPIISVSDGNTTLDAQQLSIRVSRGSSFIISCSIQSQHPGGFFKLFFTSSNTAHSTIQPAVHHCAHFLFPKAEPAHQGNYSCVYVVTVFSQTTFSESHVLSLTVSDSTVHLIKVVLLPLTPPLLVAVLFSCWKVTRRQRRHRQDNVEMLQSNMSAAGGQTTEEEEQNSTSR
ncbi:scavenger receptor cysteine-rich type 1 protein M130-like [Xiphophorus maculatus]|uniref:scavenger receptor cysteine-rich type 1 protein M130-like n=1 Tax=Xiphophorus maculatus TaxID=8083 RepID=UPI000C6E887A|nr:scavenger receptor cysteine-rich type 1 protein M130-like [Xiphophorus maculatus]